MTKRLLECIPNIFKKLSYFGKAFFILASINIAITAIIEADLIGKMFNLNYQEFTMFLKLCLLIEIVVLCFVLMILAQKSVKIMQKFFGMKLTYRVIMGFIIGIILGLVMRFFPSYFSMISLKPESFKILGSIFLDLIKMSIGPLIFASITCSVLGDKEDSKVGHMAFKSIVTFLIMTVISVIIGITATNYIKPGKMVKIDPYKIIESASSNSIVINAKVKAVEIKSASDLILDIIPNNVFKAFFDGNFLQIIFFAVIFGVSIKSSKSMNAPVGKAMKSLNEVMFKLTDIVMQIAPFGIFGFTVWIVGSQDLSLIKSLGIVIAIVYSSIFFLVYILYSLFMIFVLRLNPLKFFKKMSGVQLTGYLLSSSSAVLPQSLKVAQKSLGVSREKALFIIPFGATVNMNGSALNLGVSVIVISQVFGMDFTMAQYAYIVSLCTLGAVGTAPIPGASIFLLSGILSAVGLPIEAVALILAIDRILDMARTFGNISGDVLSSVIVDRLDDTLDKKTWDS